MHVLNLRPCHRPFFENVLEIKNVPPTVFRIPAPYERGTPEASKPQRTHTRLHFRTPLAFHHTEGVDGVFGSTFGSSTRKSATFFVATPLCHYMYRFAFYGLGMLAVFLNPSEVRCVGVYICIQKLAGRSPWEPLLLYPPVFHSPDMPASCKRAADRAAPLLNEHSHMPRVSERIFTHGKYMSAADRVALVQCKAGSYVRLIDFCITQL